MEIQAQHLAPFSLLPSPELSLGWQLEDVMLCLPRAPAQSGAGLLTAFQTREGSKFVFYETTAFLLTQCLPSYVLGGLFCHLLHRCGSHSQREMSICGHRIQNPGIPWVGRDP